MKWEMIAKDSRNEMYRKGDRDDNLCTMFDTECKSVYVSESMFIRNDRAMEPQDAESDWISHSAKYGRTQKMCPTLGMEDLEFIYKKAKELFDKEGNKDAD